MVTGFSLPPEDDHHCHSGGSFFFSQKKRGEFEGGRLPNRAIGSRPKFGPRSDCRTTLRRITKDKNNEVEARVPRVPRVGI